MTSRVRLVAGLLAVAGAAYGALRRFRPTEQAAPEELDPRALELRRRIDESRTILEERDEFESAETPVDRATAPGGDLDERRRRVHELGREAADEMRDRPGA